MAIKCQTREAGAIALDCRSQSSAQGFNCCQVTTIGNVIAMSKAMTMSSNYHWKCRCNVNDNGKVKYSSIGNVIAFAILSNSCFF